MSAEASSTHAEPPAGPPAGLGAGSCLPRAYLAEQQRNLVRALAAHGDVPESFDADRVHLAARMLANKRRHGVEKTWPGLVSALGSHWGKSFSEYASTHPIPRAGSPSDDGLAFARHLRCSGTLPPDVLPILLLAEVQHGLPLRAGITSAPRRLVLAMRIGRRPRVFVLPLDFSRPFRARLR